MRSFLPVVLLLFGATGVHGQAPAANTPVELGAPAPAPVQPQPVAPAAPAVPEEPRTPQAATRAEATPAVEQAQQEQPKRSRMIWFLAGAVVVLATVLALS